MCLNHDKNVCVDDFSFYLTFVILVISGVVLGVVLGALGVVGHHVCG